MSNPGVGGQAHTMAFRGNKLTSQRVRAAVLACTLLVPAPAAAKFDWLEGLMEQVRGVNIFVSPAGMINSDGLTDDGEIPVEIGSEIVIAIVSADSNNGWGVFLNSGFSVVNGFRAIEPSLDLRGSIRSLPELSIYVSPPSPPIYFGASAGLSEWWNARANLIGDPSRSLELKGSAIHVGGAVGFEVDVAPKAGVFAEVALRYRRFRGLTWKDGSSAVVVPVGWPQSMDVTTVFLRLGFGFSLD